MANVLQVEFHQPAASNRPYRATVARAIGLAQEEAGPSDVVDEAVADLAAGRRPSGEQLLACLAAANFPLHHLLELWTEESTRIVMRRLLMLIVSIAGLTTYLV